MTRSLRLPLLFVVLFLLSFAGCLTSPRAQDFPRFALYGTANSWGPPFTKPDGTLDSALCIATSHYPLASLPIATLDARPDIVLAMRAATPRVKVLGYLLITHWWLPETFTPRADDNAFNARWHRALVATHGLMPGAPDGYEVDVSRREVVDTLTSLLVRAVRMHMLDGVFLDYLAPVMAWTGYGSAAQDSARVVNLSRMVAAVRAAGGCGFIVYGNGVGATSTNIDGSMREGFPGALTSMSQALTQGRGDWLKSEGALDGRPYTLESCRAARFVLATACMTGAFAIYGPNMDWWVRPNAGAWWFDEWSVSPLYRGGNRADTTGRYIGWLGTAGDARRDSVTGARVRLFQHGAVILNDTTFAVTVDLGREYRRIAGVRDPWTNNNVAGRSFTVPPHDALFVQLQRRVAP